MDNRIHLVPVHHTVEQGTVADVTDDKLDTFRDHGPKACRQIVEDHDILAPVAQRQDRMAANVSGAPGYQNRHYPLQDSQSLPAQP
ncbi:hypothetical protein GCM10011587_05520 [Pyruvatibacter mobilis]|nr:hypothetical protein GCM10011587_05520 [Pyruvatibacter mobilis]